MKPKPSSKIRLFIILLPLLAGFVRAGVEPDLSAFFATPLRDGLFLYKKWIGPSKGVTCTMAPSDSAYAAQAINRFGAIGGLWRTADRLHRCGHDVTDYPVVETSDGLRYSDPVDPY